MKPPQACGKVEQPDRPERADIPGHQAGPADKPPSPYPAGGFSLRLQAFANMTLRAA